MKKTLTLLIATTALTAATGLPALSATRMLPDGAPFGPVSAVLNDPQQTQPFVFASYDDDDDDRIYINSDDDDDCYEEEEEDDDDCGTGGRNPAPAGTVTPPQNGLFGNGAPPEVQVK